MALWNLQNLQWKLRGRLPLFLSSVFRIMIFVFILAIFLAAPAE
jgi:hypothetical protein